LPVPTASGVKNGRKWQILIKLVLTRLKVPVFVALDAQKPKKSKFYRLEMIE
jgi:hypothetical protein